MFPRWRSVEANSLGDTELKVLRLSARQFNHLEVTICPNSNEPDLNFPVEEVIYRLAFQRST